MYAIHNAYRIALLIAIVLGNEVSSDRQSKMQAQYHIKTLSHRQPFSGNIILFQAT